jgi:uncharacterized membrane protein YeaQ/YmgE (transglycosylase-associated protein family)
MGLIIFLVVGLIAGAIASYLMGRQQDGARPEGRDACL